jgi:hypothetical protein
MCHSLFLVQFLSLHKALSDHLSGFLGLFDTTLASQRLITNLSHSVWHSIEPGPVKFQLHLWLAALLQWRWNLLPSQRHLPLLLRSPTRILVSSVIGGADIHFTLPENSRAIIKMQMQSSSGCVLDFLCVYHMEISPGNRVSNQFPGRTLPSRTGTSNAMD